MGNYKDIGRRVSEARKAADFATGRAFAEKVGCSLSTIQQVESGQRIVSRDNALIWAKELHVSPEYLMGESDYKTEEEKVFYEGRSFRHFLFSIGFEVVPYGGDFFLVLKDGEKLFFTKEQMEQAQRLLEDIARTFLVGRSELLRVENAARREEIERERDLRPGEEILKEAAGIRKQIEEHPEEFSVFKWSDTVRRHYKKATGRRHKK